MAALLTACGAAAPTATQPSPPKPTIAAPAAATGAPAAAAPTQAAAAPATAAAQPTSAPAAATAAPASAAATKPAAAAPSSETVYVFNVGSKDVTLIDAAGRSVRETRPLGAAVRWLSNEQSFSDGDRIWTYDFPDNKVQVIAIDPKSVEIAKTIKDLGTGPAHSVVVLPDKKKAAVNIAGDNAVAILDLASGQVDGKIKTGAFP
jgi:YVTN family beta-propeller protein